MRGNQLILNSEIARHEENPIKEGIKGIKPIDIIQTITSEYWKEWRRVLTHNESPYHMQRSLGYYKLDMGKAKSYLRKAIKKLRWYKVKYKDTWETEGTLGYNVYQNLLSKFRTTWKQVDTLKIEINYRNKVWRDKVNERYGEKSKYYKG